MKKRIFALFLLLSVLCLSACQGADTSATTKEPTGTTPPPSVQPPPTPGKLSTLSEYSTPLDQLSAYDFEKFNMAVEERNTTPITNFEFKFLENFNSQYPIQRMMQLGNDHRCVIYRLENDSNQSVLLYFVFDRSTDAAGNTVWKSDNEWYFVTDHFSSSDFSAVTIGDSAERVAEIDPAVEFDLKMGLSIAIDDGLFFDSYRLLSDGLLTIRFKGIAGNKAMVDYVLEDFVVSEIAFYPYGSKTPPKNTIVTYYPDLLQDN